MPDGELLYSSICFGTPDLNSGGCLLITQTHTLLLETHDLQLKDFLNYK
jgi:hypothetical protein